MTIFPRLAVRMLKVEISAKSRLVISIDWFGLNIFYCRLDRKAILYMNSSRVNIEILLHVESSHTKSLQTHTPQKIPCNNKIQINVKVHNNIKRNDEYSDFAKDWSYNKLASYLVITFWQWFCWEHQNLLCIKKYKPQDISHSSSLVFDENCAVSVRHGFYCHTFNKKYFTIGF